MVGSVPGTVKGLAGGRHSWYIAAQEERQLAQGKPAKQRRDRTAKSPAKEAQSPPGGDVKAADASEIEVDETLVDGEGLEIDLEEEVPLDELVGEEDEPSLDSADESSVEDPFTPAKGDEGWTFTGHFRTEDLDLDESMDPDSLPDDSIADLLGESFDEYGDPDDPMPQVPEPEQPLPPQDAAAILPDDDPEQSAVDTLSFGPGEVGVEDDPLRTEANRLLLQGKLDEALTTLSTLRKMSPSDSQLDVRYEELMARVINAYFPGETLDSMPRLTVSLGEITELVTDPLMGQLLCRMDGKTPLRDLDSALPDLAPGSLYQLLSRAKGMGLIRMD
jgi:hypothetical protein